MKTFDTLKLLYQIHQLIDVPTFQATHVTIAQKLFISENTARLYVKELRALGAPIVKRKRCFVYAQPWDFFDAVWGKIV